MSISAPFPPEHQNQEFLENRYSLINVGLKWTIVVLLFVTLNQFLALYFGGDASIVNMDVAMLSVAVNLFMALTGTVVFLLNRQLHRRGGDWSRLMDLNMHVLGVVVMASWVVHVYLAGTQNTLIVMMIPGTAMVLVWIFSGRWAWFYWMASNVALTAICYLEVVGELPYSPLLVRPEGGAEIYLDIRYRLLNGGFYAVGSAMLIFYVTRLKAALESSHAETMRAKAELAVLATTDSLTGLLVRRSILPKFEEQLVRADRDGQPLCVVILDIDNFKSVNDTYGHAVGDEVIKMVAEVLRHSFREYYDLIARIGGEEYLVVLPHNDLASGRALAERARLHLNQQSVPDGQGGTIGVTASFGVAQYLPGRKTTTDALIHDADEAHYVAKRAGKDRVCVAGDDANQQSATG
ncbi:GGDEF domain-containing protein [bacterium]|nr:GGDEF domain-containing protein [bacterium]